jgi:hypothetical protein
VRDPDERRDHLGARGVWQAEPLIGRASRKTRGKKNSARRTGYSGVLVPQKLARRQIRSPVRMTPSPAPVLPRRSLEKASCAGCSAKKPRGGPPAIGMLSVFSTNHSQIPTHPEIRNAPTPGGGLVPVDRKARGSVAVEVAVAHSTSSDFMVFRRTSQTNRKPV